MDNRIRSQVFNEAIRIGEELLTKVKYDQNGMFWKTMAVDRTKDHSDPDYIIWKKLEAVYSGNSGIALFFLELYKQTTDKTYLDAAIKAMKWVVGTCRETPSDYYAFFTGRMGIPYALLKMHEVTRENNYLEQALEIAEPCERYLESSFVVDDLINGTSGTVLGLLHLHAVTGEGWLLEKADLFLQHLIDRSHQGPVGLYWDYSSKKIRGLCGFSHGAAGIGFVFLEAGRYLQNEAFYHIAEEAFRYERYFYNAENKNWPDFRRGIWSSKDYDEHKAAYQANNTEFFTVPQFMNGWCHGAMGIGLSRLRAFDVLKKDIYAREAKIAVEKTRMTDIISNTENDEMIKYRSFTLCHGSGGNAEVFLEAYKTFGDKIYLSLAEKVALRALEAKKNRSYLSGYSFADNREDTSLLMGNAGIGYFYLKLLQPLAVPSILLPVIESQWNKKATIFAGTILKATNADIRKRLIRKTFNRTNALLEKLNACQAAGYFESHSPNGVCEEETYMEFVEHLLLPKLQPEERERVSDILRLESEKYRLGQSIDNNPLLNIKTILQSEQSSELLKDLDGRGILQLKLQLNPDLYILLTDWDWHPDRETSWFENLGVEKNTYPVLLKMDADEKVIENHISTFSYAILAAFQDGDIVENVVRDIISSFEATSAEQREFIKRSIIEQIRQVLSAGFLIHKSQNRF